MALDGADRDEQAGRDLGVGQMLADKASTSASRSDTPASIGT